MFPPVTALANWLNVHTVHTGTLAHCIHLHTKQTGKLYTLAHRTHWNTVHTGTIYIHYTLHWHTGVLYTIHKLNTDTLYPLEKLYKLAQFLHITYWHIHPVHRGTPANCTHSLDVHHGKVVHCLRWYNEHTGTVTHLSNVETGTEAYYTHWHTCTLYKLISFVQLHFGTLYILE